MKDNNEKPQHQMAAIDLIVTKGDGVALPNQKQAIHDFKEQCLELRLSSLTQELEEAKVESKMYEDASVAFYNDTLALEKEIEQLKQSPDAVVAMPEEITAEASIALNHAIGNARRASNTTLQEDMSNIYQAIRKALTNNADKEN